MPVSPLKCRRSTQRIQNRSSHSQSHSYCGCPALADDQVSLQDRFLVALALMEGGWPNEAVTVLRDLYDRAPTPRVRLELARALFIGYFGAVPTYQLVYGPLAAIPALLVWTYMTWWMFLAGALLASILTEWRAANARISSRYKDKGDRP